MKIVLLFLQVALLYVFYLLGGWIQEFFGLIIPGSIIGMLLLFGLLLSGILKSNMIEQGAALLVRHLPLLFLPVTVGIIQYFEVFRGKGLILVLIVIFSTVMVMVLSGFFSHFLWKRRER